MNPPRCSAAFIASLYRKMVMKLAHLTLHAAVAATLLSMQSTSAAVPITQ
jgi:hypothetical protein